MIMQKDVTAKIPCTFRYLFPTGYTSDALKKECYVYTLPRVGDTLFLNEVEWEVKKVVHRIDNADNSHAIEVYYSDYLGDRSTNLSANAVALAR